MEQTLVSKFNYLTLSSLTSVADFRNHAGRSMRYAIANSKVSRWTVMLLYTSMYVRHRRQQVIFWSSFFCLEGSGSQMTHTNAINERSIQMG